MLLASTLRHRRALLVAALVWISAISSSGQSNTKETTVAKHNAATVAPNLNAPAGTPTAPVKNSDAPPEELLKLTIGSSRASVTRDGSYGVFADFQNISKDIVTLKAAETMLIVQPEVSYPTACVAAESGIFPTQLTSEKTESGAAEIQLLPDEHYKVFWDLGRLGQQDSKCTQQSPLRTKLGEILGFVPGDYTFTVEGIAYTSSPTGQPPISHTYTASTTLNVSISQVLTAFAAFLGALIAYLVVALQPGHDFDRWRSDLPTGDRVKVIGVLVRNAFSAGLLGSAVTIVASRLSDTQFPIKVSVSDFWGALTIGFVAYFVGTRFILAIASRLAVPPSSPAGTKTDVSGTQVPDQTQAKAADSNIVTGNQ
jgi:hypothetical protein